MATEAPTAKVLVVCLGNICRSPMGEAVLAAAAKKRGLNIVVDSCGTAGYHVGEDPDDVASDTTSSCPLTDNARSSDFTDFTHILASDDSNLRDIKRVTPANSTADIRLWGSYLDGKSIPDPWYGGLSGFEGTYQQCTSLSEAFLDDLEGKQ
ncbi:phosphotyrosine protein phosphatase I superfamily [Mycena albidolilacea]|uniref:Phosphotyrosine protein phosphatase I superfamily n=1 Tax=Mycena albidolilacea TaxID=1033008 RepID=A0AAD7AFL1_9AGAR|nr:phosphotyrosine protein phosphatase I superfamily [Mycena albidolilacea]